MTTATRLAVDQKGIAILSSCETCGTTAGCLGIYEVTVSGRSVIALQIYITVACNWAAVPRIKTGKITVAYGSEFPAAIAIGAYCHRKGGAPRHTAGLAVVEAGRQVTN